MRPDEWNRACILSCISLFLDCFFFLVCFLRLTFFLLVTFFHLYFLSCVTFIFLFFGATVVFTTRPLLQTCSMLFFFSGVWCLWTCRLTGSLFG